MKKLIALLLVLVMVLSLGACAQKTNTPTTAPTEDTTAAPKDEAKAPEATAPEASKPEATAPTVDTSLIPAAVPLSNSTSLQGTKLGCSIVAQAD